MPDRLEDGLAGLLARGAGIGLLLAAAALFLSLVTWSLNDPSLSHATSGPTRNLLGGAGAVVSDLLLNTLGYAAVFALLAPMFWGCDLLLRQSVAGLRTKALLFPLSILLIAGALSAVPQPVSWPIRHGLGGIVGDGIYTLATTMLSAVLPGRSGLAAGLLLFATGFVALTRSIGQEVRDLLGGLRPFAGALSLGHGDRGPTRKAAGTPDLAAEAFAQPSRRQRQPDMGPLSLEPEWDVAGHAAGARGLPPEVDLPAAASEQRVAPSRARLEDDEPLERSEEDLGRALARRFAPAAAPAGPGVRDLQKQASGFLASLARQRARPAYRRPSLNELKQPVRARLAADVAQTVQRGQARLLEDTLADFGIKGEIRDIKSGPVVTVYELEPQRGTKAARVIGLADDIARSMSATSARVAVVPGRSTIGIELPNPQRQTVLLRELLEADAYKAAQGLLPLALGKSIAGDPVVADLAQMPHLLVAGTTGSGKSVGINAMILSLIYARSPEECRFLMIDPKRLELSAYNGIPHLLTPVITDAQQAIAALEWVVAEMEERYKRMSRLSVRSIDVFNNRVRNAERLGEPLKRTVQTGFDSRTGAPQYEDEAIASEPMPYIVVVVDEMADLMLVAGKEIETAIQRLSQMARAAGIHLVMATQRPSVDVVTGTIKANFPSRLAFKVATRIDSRTILDEHGAEQLLGAGDMLMAIGSGQPVRLHGAFVSDEEVERITRFLREQGEPRYVDIPLQRLGGDASAPAAICAGGGSGLQGPRTADGEALYEKAVAVVVREGKASSSLLQRRLGIGYNKAADLVERLERDGLVGPADANGRRQVLAAGEGSQTSSA